MLRRDYRDMVCGALMVAFGLSVAFYASSHYSMGTLQRMGPGMFPTGLGYILVGFGVILFVQALFRPGVVPEIRIWSPIFVIAGTAAFALVIRPFGLIPAILAVTIISSLAELRFRPVSLALLCLALSVIAWLVFRVGLGLSIPLYRWPF